MQQLSAEIAQESFAPCNSMSALGLSFTGGKSKGIISAVVPRQKASERLRSKLRTLLKERGHGSKTALAGYFRSEHTTRITESTISDFVNYTTPNRRVFTVDDLDTLAAFFRISVGELLGVSKSSDLTGDEQRMVYAFRALPPTVADHFLAIIEQASLAPRIKQERSPLHARPKSDTTTASTPPLHLGEAEHGGTAAATGSGVSVPVGDLDRLEQIAGDLFTAVADARTRVRAAKPGSTQPGGLPRDRSTRSEDAG